MKIIVLFVTLTCFDPQTLFCYNVNCTEFLALISMGGGGGGGIMAPYSFSSISPERLELRQSNFLTFVSTSWLSEKYKYVIFGLHLLPW